MKRYLLIFFILNSTWLFGQTDSLVWDNINRTYLLHLPDAYDGSEDLPLLIAMHGGFGSAINLQNQSQLSLKADEENFIVVYPEGVLGGVNNIRTWNAGWCCGHASFSNIDDVGFINALMDTLINQYAIDANRIYATGMSNGGFMSYRLACELSERISAIAPVAASMSMTSCDPIRQVPVLDFHSYLDTNVPYLGGFGTGASSQYSPPLDSVLNVWGEINTCEMLNDTLIDDDQFTHIRWSDCECNALVEQIITRDGGHSWPGGLGTPLGDPTSSYINANDLMWEFFQNYSLECNTTSVAPSNEETDIDLYPNPTKDRVYLRGEDDLFDLNVVVYNLFGKEVARYAGEVELDVSAFAPGTYFMSIQYKYQYITKKFVKLK